MELEFLSTLNRYKQTTFSNLKLLLIASFLFVSVSSYGQLHKSPIKWYTFEQAQALNKKNPRPFLIDAYTSWCGWCKHMDKTTFKDLQVANYINNKYYPVKFNAETTDTIVYNGKTYVNSMVGRIKAEIEKVEAQRKLKNDSIQKTQDANKQQKLRNDLAALRNNLNMLNRRLKRPTHDLTYFLIGKRISYPTIIYGLNNLQQNVPIAGYQDTKKALAYGTFFAEGVYKVTRDLTSYYQMFEKAYFSKTPERNVKWLTLNEALKLQKTTPKKIAIVFSSKQSVQQSVIEKACVEDPKVAQLLNDSVYAVKFDVEDTTKVTFNGVEFGNKRGIHDLLFYLMNNQPKLPSQILLTEEGKPLTNINYYLNPADLRVLYLYYFTNSYKTKQYQEFRKSVTP